MEDKWIVMFISFLGAIIFYLSFYSRVGSNLDKGIFLVALLCFVMWPSIIYGFFSKKEKENNL